MQSHLFATPQILFVGLVDDFSKNPGYSPDMLWGIHTTGMNYLIKLMETHTKKKRNTKKGRNTKSFKNLNRKFAISIY